MTHIDQLNRRLGEALGYRNSQPRFAWKWSADLHYFYRLPTAVTFERMCWAERVGRVWMIAQWRKPDGIDVQTGQVLPITREQWWRMFGGAFPYPEKGQYYGHPETAFRQGLVPTMEDTLMAIASIKAQLRSYESHLEQCTDEAAAREQRDENEWMEYVADMNPAFDNWNSGAKSGVEFQVPGMKGKGQLVTA